MCTALSLSTKNGTHLFGRNMDVEYSFNQSVLLTPRNFTYKNRGDNQECQTKYAFIGMGTLIDGHPCYAEAFNEEGLGCAGLNFPGYAHYEDEAIQGKTNLPPYDMILWVVANFKTIDEVREALKNVNIVKRPVNEQTPISPLHWMISDKSGHSIVVEKTAESFKVMENRVGVLTNAPTFEWHVTNLTQYIGLKPTQPSETKWGEEDLKPLGQGVGGLSLPGDFSSASRFVKTAFLRNYIDFTHEDYSGLTEFYHILNSVAMVRGSVVTPQHKNDITLYTACMDQDKGIYYYNTYSNPHLTAISLHQQDLDAKEIKSFWFNTEFKIDFQH